MKKKPNKQYDCFVMESFGGAALKGLQNFSRASYTQAAMRGAGVGASIGGVGNMVNNYMKRDDDPTKKRLGSAFVSGAMKGAGTGAVLGAGTRFVTNRQFAQDAMQNLAQRVHGQEVNAAVRSAATNAKATGANIGQAVQDAQRAANERFAREYGYKYIHNAGGSGVNQMKITTGAYGKLRSDPVNAARRRYYDLHELNPEFVNGAEERALPEILSSVSVNRRR